MRKVFPIIQYTCAVLLIVTSILMVSYQVLTIAPVANGLLIYVAQAFLLAGSIFGLDYYVKQLRNVNIKERNLIVNSIEENGKIGLK